MSIPSPIVVSRGPYREIWQCPYGCSGEFDVVVDSDTDNEVMDDGGYSEHVGECRERAA